MSTKTREVRTFFDEPQHYLRSDVEIRLRAEVVSELLGEVGSGRILDIGCGDGRISLQFLKADVDLTLLDLSEQMLEVARKRTPADHAARVRFVQGDILSYRPEAPFDVVLCLGVLAHVDSVEEAVAQIASFVAPGGACVLQLTDQAKLVAKLEVAVYSLRRRFVDERRYGLNYLTLGGVLSMAQRHGLQPAGSRRYSLLLPGMGRVPPRHLYRFQRCTLENRWLSRHGSEVILLLRKQDPGRRPGDQSGGSEIRS